MKKNFLKLIFLILGFFILVSWGNKGHKIVATIAEKHLSNKAKKEIYRYLEGKSMMEICSLPDEYLRSKNPKHAKYKNTGAKHFMNHKLGLSYKEFVEATQAQINPNIYEAFLNFKQKLSNKKDFLPGCFGQSKKPNLLASEKKEALIFLIHLIADMHQPFHVARKQDSGGNGIKVRFIKRNTNLHALWDTNLIEYSKGQTKKSDKLEEIIESIEAMYTDSKEIKEWENTDVLQWLFESYEISSLLYKEIENKPQINIFQRNKKNKKLKKIKFYYLNETYYQKHISTVYKRLYQGGIRLAKILNESFN